MPHVLNCSSIGNTAKNSIHEMQQHQDSIGGPAIGMLGEGTVVGLNGCLARRSRQAAALSHRYSSVSLQSAQHCALQ
jgi:hypothetical protein